MPAEAVRVEALNSIFHYVMDRACEQLTREINLVLKQLNITNRHFLVMVVIRESGNVIQQDVATLLTLNQNVILQLMDDLEQFALATRVRNPKNRRQHLLGLTPKGEKTLTRAQKLVDEVYDKCLPMSAHKRREFGEMLAQARCAPPAPAKIR
jgi:DNA-binding MarR family transcriptional regulator